LLSKLHYSQQKRHFIVNKNSFRVWRLRILQQKTKHYTKNSTKRYVMLYIRFGFEGNGTERGGSLLPNTTPQYPLSHVVSHTIAHLLQKNKNYTYCFIYLYLVLQTSLYYLSNKKNAFIAQAIINLLTDEYQYIYVFERML
jgi:hypothetical protein